MAPNFHLAERRTAAVTGGGPGTRRCCHPNKLNVATFRGPHCDVTLRSGRIQGLSE